MPSIAGQVFSITGSVSATTTGTGIVRVLLDNSEIYDGDTVQTSAGASVVFQLNNGTLLSVNESTTLALTDTVLNAANVDLTATSQISEDDDTLSYTATLLNPASGNVSVTLDNGVVITIEDGQTSGTSEFLLSPDSDVYVELDQTIDANVTSIAGSFGVLNVSTSATTTVVDSIDVTHATLTGDDTVSEGGAASYLITLDNPTDSDMQLEVQTGHVTTDNGDLIPTTLLVTVPEGETTATFEVDNLLSLADVEGDEVFSVALTGNNTTGGGLEAVNIDTTPVNTTVVENQIATVSINADTVMNTDQGFRVSAFHADGSESVITQVDDYGVQGFGVAGAASNGSDDEVGYDSHLERSECLVVELDDPVSSVDVVFAWQHAGESAGYTFYLDGVEVGVSGHQGGSDGIDPARTLAPDNGAEFDEIHLYAVGEGSDWVINDITFNAIAPPVNDHAPESTGGAVITCEDTSYTFLTSDFDFTDLDGDTLQSVRLDSLPADGVIYLDGVAVSVGSEISVSDISGGLMTFEPALHESGRDEYNQTGTGDQRGDYTTFEFSVSDGVNWSSASATMNIDVSPVADDVALTVENMTTSVTTIDHTNVANTDAGFTVTAYNVDGSQGSLVQVDEYGVQGFGVSGAASNGSDDELGYDSQTGQSEKIVVEMDTAVSAVDVAFAWLHGGESAGYSFYLDGVEVGSSGHTGGSDGIDPPRTLSPENGSEFDEIHFYAVGDGSDWVINEIRFDQTGSTSNTEVNVGESTHLAITAALIDQDGSESLTALSVTDIPVGMTLTDGVNTFTSSSGSQSVDVLGWDYDQLQLDVPAIYETADPDYTLNIVAASEENLASAVTPADPNCGLSNTTTVSHPVTVVGATILDMATVTLAATPSITEDDTSITYTATLDVPTDGDMTVTLDNGVEITIADGTMTGSANHSVTADSDVYAEDDSAVSVAIAGTSGGNFSNVDTTSTASTTIVDTLDTTTVTLTATASITEDDTSITYTATLDNPADGTMTVTLDNGLSIVIADGATSGTADYVVSADSDVYNEVDSTVTAAITSTSGGGFEDLDTSSTAVTTVTDTTDTTTLSLTATPEITEDDTAITYSATLDYPADAALTVTLDNGLEMTIAEGATSASVVSSVTADSDVYREVDSTITASITGTSTHNFENLVISGAASTTIVDSIDTTTVSLTATPQITEDDTSITYTAAVDNPVEGAMTVTLDNGVEIVIADGELAGSANLSVTADSDVYSEANSTVSAAIVSTSGGNFEALDISSTAQTTVVDSIDTVTVNLSQDSSVVEGGSVQYSVSVDQAPLVDMTVDVTYQYISADSGDITTYTSQVTLPANSTAPVSFSVDTLDDAVVEGDELYSVTISNPTDGGFEQVVVGTDTVTTTILNDDHAPVSAGGAVVVCEDTAYTFTVGDFDYSDADGDLIDSVRVDSLPTDGTLLLDGVAVAADTIIPIEDINSALLTFEPALNESGRDEYNSSGEGDQQDDYARFTFSVYDGANWSTSPSTMTVDVSPVADGVDMEASHITYTPTTITASNVNDTDAGYTVSAYDFWGNDATISQITGTSHDGFGVLGDAAQGDTAELGWWRGKSETLKVEFDEPVSEVDARFAWQTTTEEARYDFYLNGVKVGDGGHWGSSDEVDLAINLKPENGSEFDEVRFYAPELYDDWLIHDISFIRSETASDIKNLNEGETLHLDVSADLIDTDGSESIVQLLVTDVPVGMTLTDGVHRFTGSEGNQSIDILSWDQDALQLEATNDYWNEDPSYTLNFVAMTEESLNGAVTPADPNNCALTKETSVPITLVVADVVDTTFISLSTNDVDEDNGLVTFTATLTHPGETDVVVNTDQGLITIEAGQTTGSISLDMTDPDVYLDASSLTATITSVTGGNFEDLELATVTATAQITDTIDTTTVTLSATSQITEDDNAITYTATLDNPAQGAMTVTLDNGLEIAIADGATTGSVNLSVTADSDVYSEANQTITASIASTSGGNFEDLDTSSTVSTTLVDSIDVVSLLVSGSFVEGQSATSIPHGISHVIYELANGETVKIDGYGGDVKDPTDPSRYTAAIEAEYGSSVEGYTIKASTSHYDELGQWVISIPHQADHETSQQFIENGAYSALVLATPVTSEDTASFTFTLSEPGLSDVLVTTNLGDVTIPAGETSVDLDVPMNNQDEVTATVSSMTGGNFESIDVSSASYTVQDTDVSDSIDDILFMTPFIDIVTVSADTSEEIVDFDASMDILNLEDLFDDYGVSPDANTLGDYLDFSMVDSDGDGTADDTFIQVDSNGTATAGGDVTNIYFRDAEFDEISDLNIDYD